MKGPPRRAFRLFSCPWIEPEWVLPVSIRHIRVTNVSSASLEPAPGIEPPEALRYDTDWENWFAWRPVRLYMTGRIAWLRVIYRRTVSRSGIATRDFTDEPDQFATPGFES